jgi:pyruvate,water dikinase
VNAAEAVVGVQSPLSLTYWDLAGETGFRLAYVQMGLLPRSGLRIPDSIDEQYTGFFYGRCATNLDAFRATLAAMPGSVQAAEEGIFASRGEAPPPRPSAVVRTRAAAKLTVAALLLTGRLRRTRRASEAFWREVTAPGALDAPGRAAAVLQGSVPRFADAVSLQVVSSTIAGLVYGRVQALLAAAGRPDLELPLIGGYGAMSEIQLTKDLATLADGDAAARAAFLDRHGFHGPAEGELSSRSWREDPAPVERMLGALRAVPGGADPAGAEDRQRTEREDAERAVAAARPRWARPVARVELALARRFLPSRVEAKAAFMQVFDGARAAARALGADLVARGVLDEVDDVFSLTLDEVLGDPPADARAVVRDRQARRAAHQAIDLPNEWVGEPTPLADGQTGPNGTDGETGAAGQAGATINAVGVSAGVAEGVARVLVDPSDPDALRPGEVLVCHTTDPSWSCYFFVAGAVVTDIGGPLSHGAIVARELGIPCVVNTERGTRDIRSGDRIRVDGRAGTVEILARA